MSGKRESSTEVLSGHDGATFRRALTISSGGVTSTSALSTLQRTVTTSKESGEIRVRVTTRPVHLNPSTES